MAGAALDAAENPLHHWGSCTFVPRGIASAKFTASERLTGQLAGLLHPRHELSGPHRLALGARLR
jgi:hypothetical protein